MEFNQKLQELRKQKGLTQEELAEAIFVSRTAVSKWESGRGYPSIDSLKAIAGFFSVTVDELLSGEQVLTIAEADTKQKEKRYRDLVFGLLDISAALFFFLPLFGQRENGTVYEVSLLALSAPQLYLRIAHIAVVACIVVMGVLALALQSCHSALWVRSKWISSLSLNALGVLLFVISIQPYAAVLLFVFFVIKAIMLIKRQ